MSVCILQLVDITATRVVIQAAVIITSCAILVASWRYVSLLLRRSGNDKPGISLENRAEEGNTLKPVMQQGVIDPAIARKGKPDDIVDTVSDEEFIKLEQINFPWSVGGTASVVSPAEDDDTYNRCW